VEVHIYIGFEALKVKPTQYGICSQVAFKNARAMFFFEVGRGGHQFSVGFNFFPAGGKIFLGGLSLPESDTPIVRRGT
jgi:hypothetical protein